MDAKTNDAAKERSKLAETIDQILQEAISIGIGCPVRSSITAYLDMCEYHNELATEEYRVKLRAAMKAIRALVFSEDLAFVLDAQLGQAINDLQERPLPDRLITIEDVNDQYLFREVKNECERRKQGWSEEEIYFLDSVLLREMKAAE